ncbi:MAG: YfhO family protein [Anaerolineae bacterium]|nr:YfhO family protein [Anaerolineae bacterium]
MRKLSPFPPWLVVVPVALILFYPLFTGQALFWGLPAMQFVPWQRFAFDELAAGRAPLWNPYAGAGAPLLANYQTAFYYPPNGLHLLLPAHLAIGVVGVLHLIWAGWGMWVFTGALGVPAFGRTIGALAYPFSGYIIARFGTPPMVLAAAWLPWLFWGVHRVVDRRGRRDVAALGLIAAMQLLTGHAQLTFYSLLGAGLYALWLTFTSRRDRIKGLLLALAGVMLGAAIAAVQLVPTAELLRASQRAGGLEDTEFLLNFSYGPLRVLSQLTPRFFGTPADGSYQGKGAYWEDAAYIGLLPMVLAVLAFFVWLKRRKWPDRRLSSKDNHGAHGEHGETLEISVDSVLSVVKPSSSSCDAHMSTDDSLAATPFFTLLGLGAFILALGKHAPFSLYEFLVRYVSTFGMFQGPARWLLLTVFALCVMASIGAAGWGRGKWTFYGARLAAAGGVGIVVVALLAPNFIPANAALDALIRAAAALGSCIVGVAVLTLAQPDPAWGVSPKYWQAAVILFVAVDLIWAGQGVNPTVPAAFYDPIEVPDALRSEHGGRAYWFEDYQDFVAFNQESDAKGWFRFNDFTVARDNWPAVRRSMLPNMNMLDGVAYLNNFDPMQPGDHVRYLELIEEAGPAKAGPLLHAAGVSVVYGNGGPPAWSQDPDDPNRWLAPEPALRAWTVPEAMGFEDQAALEAYMLGGEWDPAQTVLLIGPELPPAGGSGGMVEIVEATPQEIKLAVQTGAGAWLALADTWYPGWRATVDGAPTDIQRANLAFRAVWIEPGEHQVVFYYAADSALAGGAITLIGLAACAALLFGRRRSAPIITLP